MNQKGQELNWLVVTTRPRSEKKVALALQQLGIEHYLPIQRQLRRWKDRNKWVDMVLFPSYVFVHLEDQRRNHVFEVDGVVRYVTFNGRPALVHQDDIERIRLICNGQELAEVHTSPLKTGDRVVVVNGTLKGLQGILTEEVNGTRLQVNIVGLGCHLSVIVERGIVRKLT